MAYNDPVLQRAMFQKQAQPSVAPAVGLGGGLGSMSSPDENAKQLRSMFSPTVDIAGPAQAIQEPQPIQYFREGGQVINGVKHFQQGGLNSIPRFIPGQDMSTMGSPSEMGIPSIPIETPPPVTGGAAAPTPAPYVPKTPIMRSIYGLFEATPSRQAAVEKAQAERARQESIAKAREENPVPTIFAEVTDEERAAAKARQDAAIAAISTPSASTVPEANPPLPPRRADLVSPPEERAAPAASTPAEAPARQKGALELTLDGIREERARSAEDKRQNALLALMQAGLAIAGGRSPNAITNIGAGGQAGIAAFASMEKARREEQAALRRDETAIRLAQAKMAEDPEAVKTFRILGGGDIMKGFEIFNADKKLQAATSIVKDITASEEDRKAAAEYIRGQLTKARTGGGSFSGFSATPVR